MENGLRDIIFTFHNVSINTIVSAMCSRTDSSFTFHNVSINTIVEAEDSDMKATLHSTMFLLILTSSTTEARTQSSLYIPQCFY